MSQAQSQTTQTYADVTDKLVDCFEEQAKDDIADAIRTNEQSFEIPYEDIEAFSDDLARDFIESPDKMFAHADKALADIHIDVLEDTAEGLTPRITNVPRTINVGELRSRHTGQFLGIKGHVSVATQVKPKTTEITFACLRCSGDGQTDYTLAPIPQTGDEIQPPHQCPNCERNGPFEAVDQEEIDHQVVELADDPNNTVGTDGHTIPVHLKDDLAGEVRAGDRIQVNGVVRTEPVRMHGQSSESTRRPWRIEAKSIDPEQVAFEDLTPTRREQIDRLAAMDDVIDRLIDAFCPRLIGGDRLRQVKLAILLQMVGGVDRDGRRSDINLFLVGDKGTGKSELLKWADKIAPKSIQVSGKGATAAGLTATATHSEYGDGWMLEPGALVMADGGLACIDEFDKMADSARKSMHEAMEQQEVPINKAGINTVLSSETAVLAAANPVGGVFDRYTDLREQINLEAPIIDRFDLVLAMKDPVDEERDRTVATHQLSTDATPVDITDELFREYIADARRNVKPEYESESLREELVEFYVKIRQESKDDETNVSPFGPRLNDALRRLPEASARLRHSDTIQREDVERAMRLTNRYIGDTQLSEDGEIDSDRGGKSMKLQVLEALDDRDWQYPSQVGKQTDTKLSEQKTRELLKSLRDEENPPRVEERSGKWRLAT